jgi:hypothetical protein
MPKDDKAGAGSAGSQGQDAAAPEDFASEEFDTEFTRAFLQNFLTGPARWPMHRTSAQRVPDLNTFSRLLITGAQTGVVNVVLDSTMDAGLFAKIKDFLAAFKIGTVTGWPDTTAVTAEQSPWKSMDIKERALRMAEAAVIIARLIRKSAMDPNGAGNDSVKFQIKPN